MRRLRLLLLGALAVGPVLGPAQPAAAQGGDPGIGHAEEACIQILEDGGRIDDCQEAPNILMPEVNEIIWGGVGFLVVFFFLYKFGMPPLRKAMADRTERIRNDLQVAERQREEAETVLAEYRAQLNDARSEAGRIIEEARRAADQLKVEQQARLEEELAEQRARAVADIEAAKEQAMADLRGELVELAVGAAETVVQRNLDTATQTQLVEEYINQVAAQRP